MSASATGPRSIMTVPGNRPDMLEKAPSYGADALVFDLQDSVPLAEKPKARGLVREYIAKHRSASSLYARVNAAHTGMLEDDLDAIVIEGLVGIRLPKVESAEAILEVDALLRALEAERGVPPGHIAICPGLESAKGVWFAYEILSSSPRIRTARCGTAQDGDLQTDVGYTWTAEGNEVLCIRSQVIVAARAAGVPHVLDGTYANVRDPEGLQRCCEAVRKLGFRGKSVIHPNQIGIVNRIFSTPQEAR